MITRDEAQAIAVAVVKECRLDVDEELKKLHQADKDNAWSEDKARMIAEHAAELAVKQITENFYMGVGKKTIAIIGAAVVAVVILAKDNLKALVGMK